MIDGTLQYARPDQVTEELHVATGGVGDVAGVGAWVTVGVGPAVGIGVSVAVGVGVAVGVALAVGRSGRLRLREDGGRFRGRAEAAVGDGFCRGHDAGEGEERGEGGEGRAAWARAVIAVHGVLLGEG
ncbi:hypothetical protein GON03_18190 [Nocardioides sp. MAH-18]|uniref:Uncharacterized protein n=1 Tax=Nocardioides agri TaxID=2682843 RepID=A0A6L6Y0M0_9ACTN|nr:MULTISPECIES: hypothetical protein [unclassified Nocardioides]MBA2956272.1 hypothetical protein [Nocardioides sp. CGMCC 1.13656]MVQ51115.1 hypothetical protein [Nocardioides sp. MAH-18]